MENEVKFEIKISKKDLSNFMIYHNYHSMQGAIGLLISAAALVLLIAKFRALDTTQIAVLAVLALVFTVVTPLILIRKASAQEKRNKTFARPITYELREDGFSLYQEEEKADLEWRNVYKVVDSGHSLILYISTVRAFIWPKNQIKDQYAQVTGMLKAHLEPRKLKIKGVYAACGCAAG